MDKERMAELEKIEAHGAENGWIAPMTAEDREFFAYFRSVFKRYNISPSKATRLEYDFVTRVAASFSTRLQSAHMGIVSEIADEFISNDGELAKVLVEAIESNRKNIETLNSKIDNLGDAHAIGMDSDKMYTHRGAAMIIESSIAPTSAPDRHPYQPSKVPSFVGQIWVQTGTANAWIATGVSNVGDWHKINLV